MNKIQALQNFWSGFTWKAYDENSVPEDAPAKRITYEVVSDDFEHPVACTINLWDRSTSWRDIELKEIEIAQNITRGGRIVCYDDGAFWIKKANPWAQRLAGENDDMSKRIVLNIEIEFID